MEYRPEKKRRRPARADARAADRASPVAHSRPAGQERVLRIIGGSWRGRKLRFPPSAEIRPTPDRVRETLFNWLSPRMTSARCLDLFAGSGALGLESLSRGAAHVTFVERDAAAVRELRARLTEWGAAGAQVEHEDALRFLERRVHDRQQVATTDPYHIVFLDPPFDSGLLTAAAESLERGQWLDRGALIYVECAARNGLPTLPDGWVTAKAKQAGEVGYYLLRRN